MSDASDAADPISRWEQLSETSLVDCPVFELVSRRLRHPRRKTESDFYVLKTRDWVNVVPLTAQGEIVLVRQYRFGTEDCAWEIPGGIIDPGEAPLAAATRELEEETGYRADRVELMGDVAANPAIMNNRCFLALATGCEATGEIAWDPFEEIECRSFPAETVLAMARDGRIRHSLVIAALFHFAGRWPELRAALQS